MSRTSCRISELPACYGKSHIILLDVKPGLAHAFWEVTPEDARRAVERSGLAEPDIVWMLRFHEDAGTFDVEIDPGPGNRYVHLPPENCVCSAEIGVRTGSGGFVPVCNSLGRSIAGAAKVPAEAPGVPQPSPAPARRPAVPHVFEQAPSSFAIPLPRA